MRALDTNLLVRLIVRDDAQQVDRAEAFIVQGAWVPHLVLAEAVWVLGSVYELTAPRIALVIEMLLEHERLVVQDADVVRSALVEFKRQPNVGFVDCLVVAVARKAGHLPIGTFDRSMARIDGAVSP